MNDSKPILPVSTLIAALPLLLAYGLEQFWVGAVAAMGLGFWGWYDLKKGKWAWRIDVFLAGVVILATTGALLGLRLYLLLPALLSAITAWDLARFQTRMGDSPTSEKLLDIEKRHLSLLSVAIVGGGVSTAITLAFQFQLSFAITLILGVILVISLGQIYRLSKN